MRIISLGLPKAARLPGQPTAFYGSRSDQGKTILAASSLRRSNTRRAPLPAASMTAHPVFSAQLTRLADLATRHRIAATYTYRAFVEAGGLISYGPLESDPSFSRRRAAYFVDKLLKGVKVAELPVEQPTKFYLAINLKTARALGLAVPTTLLATAAEVIE